MDNPLTSDGDIVRSNQDADTRAHLAGTQGQSSMDNGMDGGATVPGGTPAEVPADNRDAGNEMPSPGGDTMPTPDTTPTAPDTPEPEQPSPTPAPSEVPKVGGAGMEPRMDNESIASNERGNSSLGSAIDLAMDDQTSSTEDALRRSTGVQGGTER